jgi:hypothetical protein
VADARTWRRITEVKTREREIERNKCGRRQLRNKKGTFPLNDGEASSYDYEYNYSYNNYKCSKKRVYHVYRS